MAKQTSTPTRPVQQFRVGSIKAAIWENQTESGTRHQATFSRGYKTDDGWKDTTSFGLSDLPILEKVANMAFDWIHQVENGGGGE